jgi:hypothetical protein
MQASLLKGAQSTHTLLKRSQMLVVPQQSLARSHAAPSVAHPSLGHWQDPASKVSPEGHAGRHELSVAQKFGNVLGHPHVQVLGSRTCGAVQLFGQTHAQSPLRTFGASQLLGQTQSQLASSSFGVSHVIAGGQPHAQALSGSGIVGAGQAFSGQTQSQLVFRTLGSVQVFVHVHVQSL